MKKLFTNISLQTIVSFLKKLVGPAIIIFLVLCIAGAVWFSQPWVTISETLPTNPSAELQKIESQIDPSSTKVNDREIIVVTNQLIGYSDGKIGGHELYVQRYTATYTADGTQFIVKTSTYTPIIISLYENYVKVDQPSETSTAKNPYSMFPPKIQSILTNIDQHNATYTKIQQASAKIATDYFKTMHVTPR